jgi:TPP-dependent pyruvate/acetoin dehydrogenase alpha subunit
MDLLSSYSQMLLIREFEEAVGKLFTQGLAPGTSHLSIGQEACAVGATTALEPKDYVFSTHRGHGHFLAKGADPKLLMAEMLGKATGYCQGRGGSQHVSSPDIGFIGTNGITGGNIPVATGAALTAQYLGNRRVILVFFGDGACNQGTFHESLNMASLWKLPVVYFLENNQYGQWTRVDRSTAIRDLALRADGYGMPGITIDGMDIQVVHETTKKALDRARTGGGPTLIEASTYRFTGHSKSDINTILYRTEQEEASWRERDPLVILRAYLLEQDLVTETGLDEIETEVAYKIEEAVNFAVESPVNDLNLSLDEVYAPHGNSI